MPADCVEQARDPPEMIDGAGFRRFAVSLVADDEWLKSPVVFSFWRVPPFEQEVRFVLDQAMPLSRDGRCRVFEPLS